MSTADFVNPDEAAKILGVKKSYLYQLVHKKKIPYYKPREGLLVFDAKELEEYIRMSRVEPINAHVTKK